MHFTDLRYVESSLYILNQYVNRQLFIEIQYMLGFDFKKVSAIHHFRQNFEDLGIIGSGGFAQVHKVRHLLNHIQYAIKIIKIKPSNNSEQTQQKVYKLMSEPKIHANLYHHNILKYHGCWMEVQSWSEQQKRQAICEQQQPQVQFELVVTNKSGGSDDILFGERSHGSNSGSGELQREKEECKVRFRDGSKIIDYKQIKVYIMTELCQLNLQNFIYLRNVSSKQHSLTSNDIYNCHLISLDLIAALSYLHSKRVIHRDVKLHNAMITPNGTCKLIDFGLAKRVKYWKNSIEDHYCSKQKKEMQQKEGEEHYSSSIGTKLFSSPEQATSENYDYRTDIYSLGIVIVLLFNTYTTAHQERDLLEKIRKRNLQDMQIDQSLKILLFKCLGQQSERPSLSEIQKCIKQLMRQMVIQKLIQKKDKTKISLDEAKVVRQQHKNQ